MCRVRSRTPNLAGNRAEQHTANIFAVPVSQTLMTKLHPAMRLYRACGARTALLMARSYPPGGPLVLRSGPDDFAVVAELVDAQR